MCRPFGFNIYLIGVCLKLLLGFFLQFDHLPLYLSQTRNDQAYKTFPNKIPGTSTLKLHILALCTKGGVY